MTTREQFVSQFATKSEAAEFESGVLSAGREFLPAAAIAVLDKTVEEPSPEYWSFLISQIDSDGTCAEAPALGDVDAWNARESETEGGLDVDFTLTLGTVEHDGEVTLVRRAQDGSWSSWGELSHWLDGRTVELLRGLPEELRRDAIAKIESACAAECGQTNA